MNSNKTLEQKAFQHFLKDCATVLKHPLSLQINVYMKSRKSPSMWKSSKTRMIYKVMTNISIKFNYKVFEMLSERKFSSYLILIT